VDANRAGRRQKIGEALAVALEVEIARKLENFTLDVSFAVDGAPLGILGPSGAGKSMLLRAIAGLERPDRGRIALDGRVLFDSQKRIDVPARERRMGMLFQHYALFPHLTVEENVAFGLQDLPRAERNARVGAALERTHADGLRTRYPRQISGGEQQRAALARALSTEPQTLLLDEPLSALDTHLRGQIEVLLSETFATFERPALLVTHNMEEAYRLAQQLLVLIRGRVAALGPREDIFRHPPNLEVARLTGCKNFSCARAISDRLVEAIDWVCQLRTADPLPASVAHIGLRAHHIEFVETKGTELSHEQSERSAAENIFPCWPVGVSETPFRVTLHLRLHQAPTPGEPQHLQAELFKEKWELLRDRPLPWHVRLRPDALFAVAD
jgi:ABC-type sulfate/molybdate transport systems ATPase subunit